QNRIAKAPINLSRSAGFSTAGNDGLKIDANNIAHVVFADDSANVQGSDLFYTQSTDGGKSYATRKKVSADGTTAFNGALALDAAGNIYIVWTTLSDSK